jgi:ABC-type multidrug transport system permease subunit
MPYFALQRSLYEVRERPSKAYSWIAFILASIVVEIPWNLFMAVPAFFVWYYPIGLYQNAEPTDSVISRGGTMFLIILLFMLFTSTFTMMVVAGINDAATAGQISQLLFSLCLVFCGYVPPPILSLSYKANNRTVSSSPPVPSPASGFSCTASPPSPTWSAPSYPSG